jgi:D-inositol-3-phosphate glycosyltransferase
MYREPTLNAWEKTRLGRLSIAMLSIHSSPLGPLGTKNTGGMSIVVSETAWQLGMAGHRIDIYTAAQGGAGEKVAVLGKNVRLIHLGGSVDGPVPKSQMVRHLPRYYDALDDFARGQDNTYDLLHSHYWLSGRVGRWAQRDWQVPHVITFHTLGRLKNDLGPHDGETDLRIEQEGRLARSCHRVLAATPQEAMSLAHHCRIDVAKVGIVPFGVDTDTFDLQNPEAARERLGLAGDESLILFVGRFVPLKGVERLLEALSLFDSSEKARLLLVGGDGPEADATAKLRELSRHLDIDDRVTFAGRIEHDRLADYYNAADVLALPSYYESFGLVVLEALSCGTPVVATPVGVVESVVCNGENGAVVEEHTAASLAQSLLQVVAWLRAGRIRRREVRASVLKFDWAAAAKATAKEYVKAIASQVSDLTPTSMRPAVPCENRRGQHRT